MARILVATHAVRLLRRDLRRLSDLHYAQFVAAIAPGRPAVAESLVETGEHDAGDAHGLVFVRLQDTADPAFSLEGWLLDDERAPAVRASPDGGAFFAAGTTEPAVVEMSQRTLSGDAEPREAIAALLSAGLPVAVRGPSLKGMPPFSRATAPRAPKSAKAPKSAESAGDFEVAKAERFTEALARAAPEPVRFQLLHALRPSFATPTPEGMESFGALGGLYGMIDPGPAASDPRLAGGHRRGLLRVRLSGSGAAAGDYDGWFWADAVEDAASYWPSRRATATSGRLLVAGAVTPTGVEVSKGRIRVSAKGALPNAKALAGALKSLGLTFEVEVVPPPAPGQTGFFGTDAHRRQVGEMREYAAQDR